MQVLETIQVKESEVRAAVARAGEIADGWQAACCEIARLPQILQRLRELNPNLSGLDVEVHAGLTYHNLPPEENRAIGEARLWSMYAGYQLKLFKLDDHVGAYYNRVGDEGYNHDPSRCWDGMRRSLHGHMCVWALLARVGGLIDADDPHLKEAHVEYVPGE